MAIALLSGDLAVISRVDGAAKARGKWVVSAGNVERLLATPADQELDAAIVDLSGSATDLQLLVHELKKRSPAPRIIAFGPHVHEERLAAAREVGCDQVLSRGQFFSQLDSVIARCET
jgi:hypothetical protein